MVGWVDSPNSFTLRASVTRSLEMPPENLGLLRKDKRDKRPSSTKQSVSLDPSLLTSLTGNRESALELLYG